MTPTSTGPDSATATLVAPRRTFGQMTFSLLKRLSLLVGTFASLLASLEIGTRLFTNISPPLSVQDPEIGKRHVKNFHGSVFVDECGRDVELRFTSDGFRGPDLPHEKKSEVRRVAVLGDSMVAAVATDESKTMVAQLEQMLNASHPEHRWEVMNFGVAGASPGQSLALYRKVVKEYHPDIVLCAFFVGNDLCDISHRLSTNPRIYFDLDKDGNLVQLPFSASRAKISSWLNDYSRFYVWQKQMIRKATLRVRDTIGNVATATGKSAADAGTDPAGGSVEADARSATAAEPAAQVASDAPPVAPAAAASNVATPTTLAVAEPTASGDEDQVKMPAWFDGGDLAFCSGKNAELDHAWLLTREVMRAFRDEVQQDKGMFAVVLIPSSKQVYDDLFKQVLDRAGEHARFFDQRNPDRRLDQICRQIDVPLVLMADAFCAAAPHRSSKEPSEWLFLVKGTGHFNDAGNRIAAEQLYRFLAVPTGPDPAVDPAGAATAFVPFVKRLR